VRVKTEEKRHAIIEIAAVVFRAKGFAAASMAEISARLGGSKGTLYNYFTSKEELFAAVVVELGQQLTGPMFDELEQSKDAQTAIRLFALRLVRLLASAEALDFRRMLIAEGARCGIGKLAYDTVKKDYRGKFASFYRAQASAGVLREADPQRAAMHIEGLCSAGPIEHLLEGVIDHIPADELAATAESAADVFLRAYLADEPRARRPRSRRAR